MSQPIVIGIGSNLDNRWDWIAKAISAMNKAGLRVKNKASLYENQALLPPDAPADWDKPYLNTAVLIDTEQAPLACLATLKDIEKQLGRDPGARSWAPRTIDLDILIWGDQQLNAPTLVIPHAGLLDRLFALLPLSELCPGWICPKSYTTALGLADACLQLKGHLLHRVFAPHTQLVGIANITPDSFSDGGVYSAPDLAHAHIESLIVSGATVIDIGAQSTRPGAPQCGPEAEWARLAPILTVLSQNPFKHKVQWSIDTYHTAVARQAIEQFDVDWINDVSGGADSALCDLLAATGKKGVFMHALSVPVDPTQHLPYEVPLMDCLHEWAVHKIRALEAYGLLPEQIILDPGIGFGKTAGQSLQLIKQVGQLHSLGVPLLVGHSRKSFMGIFTQVSASERDIETLGISGALYREKIDYLRVHQVDWHRRYLASQYAAEGPK
jgi:2-amino-4-hydroxy-6-hydroxymethyldihydropteridine diphosphokinase/dihydropteroate synthase